jgi:phage/plasmid-like protein (TIGR03299 family)
VAHELETMADGRTAFATARVPAWHRLGYVAPEPMTAAELLDKALLGGWNVRRGLGLGAIVATGKCLECNRKVGAKHTQKCPVPSDPDRGSTDLVVTELDTAELIEYQDDLYPIIRTNPVTGKPETLGVASPEYPIVQPEELAEFMQAVTDQSGGVFETGGSMRGGKDIFMTMKLPETIKIGGSDEVELYLAGLNNYSAQKKLRLITTPVRVVCANTERAALADTRSYYEARHSSGLHNKLMQAREALKITFEWTEAFKAEAEAMINTQMSNDEFDKLIKSVWPEKWTAPTGEWRAPQQEQWESLQGLFRKADTQENIRGTVWAGYQSVVEYLDWEVPVVGTEDAAEIATARATRSFGGTYDQLKIDTFNLCQNLVAAR